MELTEEECEIIDLVRKGNLHKDNFTTSVGDGLRIALALIIALFIGGILLCNSISLVI
jgi:hypothetical protein